MTLEEIFQKAVDVCFSVIKTYEGDLRDLIDELERITMKRNNMKRTIKKIKYRCKTCIHSRRCRVQDAVMYYCTAHKRYCPSPLFVEAWGCGEYEDIQLKLELEERREDK